MNRFLTAIQRDFLTLSQMTPQDCISINVSSRAQEKLLSDLAWAMDRVLLVSHPVPGSACNQEQPIGLNVVTDESSGAKVYAADSGLTADKHFEGPEGAD